MMRLQANPASPTGEPLTVTVAFSPPRPDGRCITLHVATVCEAIANAPREVGGLITQVRTRYDLGVVEVEAVVPEGQTPEQVTRAIQVAVEAPAGEIAEVP